MYPSFEAVVRKGRIEPVEKIKLKDSTRILVTIVDGEDDISKANWTRLKGWIAKQRKAKKVTSYSSIETAKLHLHHLMKS